MNSEITDPFADTTPPAEPDRELGGDLLRLSFLWAHRNHIPGAWMVFGGKRPEPSRNDPFKLVGEWVDLDERLWTLDSDELEWWACHPHPVTQPRLNVKLIPPQFPIAAPRLTSLSTPCRSGKKLIDQNIKRGVGRDRGSTRVFNLQAGEGQFRILFRSMDSPRRLAPLTSQRISDADPDKEPSWFEFSDVAASTHGFEGTGEDRTDTLAGMVPKCIGVHSCAANAEGRSQRTGPDLRF